MRRRLLSPDQFLFRYVLLPGLVILSSVAASCRDDTSQLSPAGLADYRSIQVVRGVNDVTTAVITANKTPNADGMPILSDAATAQVLTINKQVLDFIEANPVGFKEKALAIVTNARQALPPGMDALIGGYLADVMKILQAVS